MAGGTIFMEFINVLMLQNVSAEGTTSLRVVFYS